MLVRAFALFGACLVGGCYNPSFGACELACASGDVCPSGFRCSAGLCAPMGGTGCDGVADARGDADSDGPQGACGDRQPNPGVICFGAQQELVLGSFIVPHDARLMRANTDDIPDLVFAGSNPSGAGGMYAAEQMPTTIGNAMSLLGGAPGPRGRFATYDSTGDEHLEIFTSMTNANTLELWTSSSNTWIRATQTSGMPMSPDAIVVGRLGSGGTLVAVYEYTNLPSLVYVPVSGGTLGGGLSFGRAYTDLAAMDVDGDNVDELIGSRPLNGIDVMDVTSGSLLPKAGFASNASATKLAVASVRTSQRKDLVFLNAPSNGPDGAIGTLVSTGQSMVAHSHPIAEVLNVLTTADVDRDGHDDAIFARREGTGFTLAIALGRADGDLDPNIHELPIDAEPRYLHADVDIDQDGCNEIVITTSTKVILLHSNC